MNARRATADDAAELVRLRAVMIADLSLPDGDDNWREPSRQILAKRLDEPSATMAAFVVDRPDGAGEGLAACVVGTIEQRLGRPGDPEGRTGYVFSVATDPDMRRRGYSRQCMNALLNWYREAGLRRVDLRASPDGAPLYRSLGFTPSRDPAMRLQL
jgi:GNAT superfamily N-acetyltransferase